MPRVLIVDDEPDVRLVARVILNSAGYDVDEAESGEEALAHIRDQVPDAVLLDVRMPGIDGWEVLRQLRGRPSLESLPVVVFTAHVTARDEAPETLRDYEHLVTKPFQPDDLLRAIEAAIV